MEMRWFLVLLPQVLGGADEFILDIVQKRSAFKYVTIVKLSGEWVTDGEKLFSSPTLTHLCPPCHST